MAESRTFRAGAAGRRWALPAWAGLCLFATYSVVRGAAGFGGGGAAAGLVSLPDAPNRPGLVTSVGGSAGAGGSFAGLLCPSRRRAPRRAGYRPDQEDVLLWRSLRRAVPGLRGWDDRPGQGHEPPGDEQPRAGVPGHEPPPGEPPGREPRAYEPSVADPDPDRLPSVIALFRRRPCVLIAAIGMAVSLLALAVEFVYLRSLGGAGTGTDIVRNAIYGAWTVSWMMLATVALRTFRLRDVARFWLLGFFAAVGIVGLVGTAVTAALPPGLLRTAIVIPVLEEMVKALMLAAFLAFAVRGRSREPSVTDMIIVGFAVGAAFGVHEDALWVRVPADGFGAGWGVLFPIFVWERFVLVTHAGWTALTGLGFGLAWHWRRHRPAWILAAVPLALAVFDHVSINYALLEGERGVGGVGFTMRQLTGHGSLVAQAVLVGFLAAVVVDWLLLRRRLASDPLPEWSTLPGMRARVQALPTVRAKLLGVLLLLGERRFHLGARYASGRTEPRPGGAVVDA